MTSWNPREAAAAAVAAAGLIESGAPADARAALDCARRTLAGKYSADDVAAAARAVMSRPGLAWRDDTQQVRAILACLDTLMAAECAVLADRAETAAQFNHFRAGACAAARRAVFNVVRIDPGLESRIAQSKPLKPPSKRL